MKKIFMLFAAMVCAAGLMADCQDGPYGLQINGTTVVDAPKFGDPDAQGRVQYKASCVDLKAGDIIKLINQSCDATWMVDIDPYGSYENFEGGASAGQLTCKVAGSYDFYIKLSASAGDLVYIGPGEGCSGQGGDTPGGQGGGDEEDVNYYAIGWINGADHGEAAYDKYEDDLMFVDGKLTIDCQMGSYIAIKDHLGNFYYAEGTSDATGDQVTMKWANGWTPCQKWALLEGTRYIIIRSATCKGQIQLESVDKATYDAYHFGGQQGVKNTTVSKKARKEIIDGQLRIVRGDKMYDATGREL